MDLNVSIAQTLLQRALNLMETAACWERKASKKAHMCCLQGEKRRLRYLYRKSKNIVDWLEHKAFDVLKIDICAQPGSVDVSTLLDTRSTVEGIISKLWTIYNEAHEIANELLAAKFKRFAKPIQKYADKLFDIIDELQRADMEYNAGNYEYHHISRYQVGWKNVHDNYKKKEKKQGYKGY